MTEKQLNKLYYIRIRIKNLKKRIAELEKSAGLSGVNLSGMPHGTDVSNPTEALQIKKEELHEELIRILNKEIEEEQKIQRYIESVEDEEVKLIMELRFIQHLKWHEMIPILHYDRTSPAKKMRKYLEEH